MASTIAKCVLLVFARRRRTGRCVACHGSHRIISYMTIYTPSVRQVRPSDSRSSSSTSVHKSHRRLLQRRPSKGGHPHPYTPCRSEARSGLSNSHLASSHRRRGRSACRPGDPSGQSILYNRAGGIPAKVARRGRMSAKPRGLVYNTGTYHRSVRDVVTNTGTRLKNKREGDQREAREDEQGNSAHRK